MPSRAKKLRVPIAHGDNTLPARKALMRSRDNVGNYCYQFHFNLTFVIAHVYIPQRRIQIKLYALRVQRNLINHISPPF